MATRKEIEAQIAKLTAALDDADTDDVVYIKDGDHEIKVSGKRATTILGRYAHLWETSENAETESEENASADTEDGTDSAVDDADDSAPDAKPTGGYFGRKR